MGKNTFNVGRLVSPEEIWEHHRVLCREIGPRLLGTENDRRAAGYIESHFARCGLVTRRQEYPCPSWEHMSTVVRTSGGGWISPPEGGASMFSLPCDVSGRIENVTSIEQLKQADCSGKICVLSGGFLPGVTPLGAERNQVLLLLEEKKPLAVILVDHNVPTGDTYMTKIVRDPEFKVPVCSISKRSGDRLLENADCEVSVKIDAHRFSSRTWNIFGSTTAAEGEKIRVAAHYDTTSDCPGAKDDGSGTAVIMGVAEALCRAGINVPVEFIAFGAEEYAQLGSAEYLRAFPDEVAGTRFMVNVDSIASCGTESRIYNTGEIEELNISLEKHVGAAGNYHGIIAGRDKMNLCSDHSKFYSKGVPVVFMHDTQPFFHHTPLDIPRFISLERLEDAAKIILGIILDLAS